MFRLKYSADASNAIENSCAPGHHLYALPCDSKAQLIRLRGYGMQCRFLIIPSDGANVKERNWKISFWGEIMEFSVNTHNRRSVREDQQYTMQFSPVFHEFEWKSLVTIVATSLWPSSHNIQQTLTGLIAALYVYIDIAYNFTFKFK